MLRDEPLSTEASNLFRSAQEAWAQNNPAVAADILQRALELAPDHGAIEFALGCALLKSGDLPRGFPHYNRWRQSEAGRRAAPRLPVRRWIGQPIQGRHLLIWGEDGFGDQLMYLRYAIALRDQGARISWICPPSLSRIIESVGLRPLRNDQPFEISDADYYCPSSYICAAAGTTFASIRGNPYIEMPAASYRSGEVGIMAFSAPHHGDGTQKTLPPELAAQLLGILGTVNLDPNSTGAQDFYDTANIVAGLRLVVTVDTAVAHLAGAMGVPTLILLPHVADWRWFVGREDSPWYNSVRLERQIAPGDWHLCIERTIEKIKRLEIY